jgi:hypothetical protein
MLLHSIIVLLKDALDCLSEFTPGQILRMHDEFMIYRKGTQPCSEGEGIMSVELKLDESPEQNSWLLLHADGSLITLSFFGAAEEYRIQSSRICVPYNQPLYFSVVDEQGDGFSSTEAYFSLRIDGKLIKSGSSFGKRGVAGFTMRDDNGCPVGEALVQIEMLLDDFPTETSWGVLNDIAQPVFQEEPYQLFDSGFYYENASILRELCLPEGKYTMYLYDRFGDGFASYDSGEEPYFRVNVRGEKAEKQYWKNGQSAKYNFEVLSEDTQLGTPEPTPYPTPEPSPEPTPSPTPSPTATPTPEPTPVPTREPTPEPTLEPTPQPSPEPSSEPTPAPTPEPTEEPTPEPSPLPTPEPTEAPSPSPTIMESEVPTIVSSLEPTTEPSVSPSSQPTPEPTPEATPQPSSSPTASPTKAPTPEPSIAPSVMESSRPSGEGSMGPTLIVSSIPTNEHSIGPSPAPSENPTSTPSAEPSLEPSPEPSPEPTPEPTSEPTTGPTSAPTRTPTFQPTPEPTTSEPSVSPTIQDSSEPSIEPTPSPTPYPTTQATPDPTTSPTPEPSSEPTPSPTPDPTEEPTPEPTPVPTTTELTNAPTDSPSAQLTTNSPTIGWDWLVGNTSGSNGYSSVCNDILEEQYYYVLDILVPSVACQDAEDIEIIGQILADNVQVPYSIFDTADVPPDNGLCTSTLTNETCGGIFDSASNSSTYLWKSGGICGLSTPDDRCKRKRRLAEWTGDPMESISGGTNFRLNRLDRLKASWMTEEQKAILEDHIERIDALKDAYREDLKDYRDEIEEAAAYLKEKEEDLKSKEKDAIEDWHKKITNLEEDHRKAEEKLKDEKDEMDNEEFHSLLRQQKEVHAAEMEAFLVEKEEAKLELQQKATEFLQQYEEKIISLESQYQSVSGMRKSKEEETMLEAVSMFYSWESDWLGEMAHTSAIAAFEGELAIDLRALLIENSDLESRCFTGEHPQVKVTITQVSTNTQVKANTC